MLATATGYKSITLQNGGSLGRSGAGGRIGKPMEVKFSREFDAQRERFAFRFTCEHCAHFDDEKEVCIHGFPNEMHRLGYYIAEKRPKTIVFCKDFDLG